MKIGNGNHDKYKIDLAKSWYFKLFCIGIPYIPMQNQTSYQIFIILNQLLKICIVYETLTLKMNFVNFLQIPIWFLLPHIKKKQDRRYSDPKARNG